MIEKICKTCEYRTKEVMERCFGKIKNVTEIGICENAGSGKHVVSPDDTCTYWESREAVKEKEKP